MTPVRRTEPLLISLTPDGRLIDRGSLDRLQSGLADVTDCFVFCHGWLYDEAEARDEAARFFALLDIAVGPLGRRVAPLRVAIHWPSKPFGDTEPTPGSRSRDTFTSELQRTVQQSRRGTPDARRILLELCEAEVPLGPEEEIELDRLARLMRDGAGGRGGSIPSPFHALSFWTMKRRAGQVGERIAREYLAPLWATLPHGGPRLHLVGHSFGAKLVTSAVLGGLRPHSVTLVLGAFSAFAFAPEIPGFGRPGFYHRVVAEEQVRGPIVVLHSRHDRALGTLYPAITGGGEVGRGRTVRTELAREGKRPIPGRLGHMSETVATSALGFVGARGVGAPEVDLVDAMTTGIPRYRIVNVDGSRVVQARHWLLGAHRDIHHQEIATLVLLSARLLEPGPDGVRPRRLNPLDVA